MAELTLEDGRVLVNVHEEGLCGLAYCCIHNPSDHPLKDEPLDWLETVGVMGRRCEHGYWHPDPDAMDFLMATMQWILLEAVSSVHLVEENCDGCCHA